MKALLSVSVAILLHHLSISAHPLVEPRDDGDVFPPYAIWNGTGPGIKDIKQVTVLNCWWPASSLAVLIANPNWHQHMIRHADGRSMLNESWPQDTAAQVTLWHPGTGDRFTHLAEWSQRSQTEDHPRGNWWHDAFSQAVLAMGAKLGVAGVASNGTWDAWAGSARLGLTMLTGYETVTKPIGEYVTVDDFYRDMGKAAAGTPVVFNTLNKAKIQVTTPQLGDSHDYAVFNASLDEQGNQVICARNSWGSTACYPLQQVFDNTYQIFHLKNWQVLDWVDTSDPPTPDNTVMPEAFTSVSPKETTLSPNWTASTSSPLAAQASASAPLAAIDLTAAANLTTTALGSVTSDMPLSTQAAPESDGSRTAGQSTSRTTPTSTASSLVGAAPTDTAGADTSSPLQASIHNQSWLASTATYDDGQYHWTTTWGAGSAPASLGSARPSTPTIGLGLGAAALGLNSSGVVTTAGTGSARGCRRRHLRTSV
ncbi:hypothetical protein IAU60_006836 [Kwoniella sp. DSM 27419]